MDITIRRVNVYKLLLPGNVTVTTERIGKGRFCTAYLAEDNHTVYLSVNTDRGDHSKEMLIGLQGLPHIPVIEEIGTHGANKVYKTVRYNAPLRAIARRAWKDYRILAKAQNEHYTTECNLSRSQNRQLDFYAINCATVHSTRGKVAATVTETLENLADAAANYGSYLFEFAARNLASDDSGELILLDPVFDWESVRRESDARMKKVRGY